MLTTTSHDPLSYRGWLQEVIVDIEEVNEKVERVLDLVGADITHRVMTEWLKAASVDARKKFGNVILDMIPDAVRETVSVRLQQYAVGLVEVTLAGLRPLIEAQVKAEVEAQAALIAALIAAQVVDRVQQRVPHMADQYMSETIRRSARGG